MARTVVMLRDDLVRKAKAVTGLHKKTQVVNLALERLIQQREMEHVLTLRNTGHSEGDLSKIRGQFDFSR